MRVGAAFATLLISIAMVCALAGVASAQQPSFDASKLAAAFSGARKVDLSKSDLSSVVALRDTVGIPPPTAPALVKTFDRASLPAVLKPAFSNPNISGVTIAGRYIAIIRTELHKEYEDILRHELVHAYITMASPKPLPFWFQEGSAVHFSTDKTRKFYGQPSKDQTGVMVGKTVEVADTYKQKLQSFHFLIEKVGKKKFYEWYREAVESGEVDARPLLGIQSRDNEPLSDRRPFPLWLGGVIGATVIAVFVIGYFTSKRNSEYE